MSSEEQRKMFTFVSQTGDDDVWTKSHAEFKGGETGLAQAEVPVHVRVRSLHWGLAEHDDPRYSQTHVEVPVVC